MSESPTSRSRPFAAAPDPSRYFPSSSMEEARQRVMRSVQRGEGPVLVIGTAGLGKSMLLEVVAQQFRQELDVVVVAGGQLCTRRALLQMVLFQLGLSYKDMDESELRLALLSHLQPQGAPARRILLLVDEADAIPQRLLEELRSLTNLSVGGQLLVNLVLAGNSNLEEQFADPKLELFSQRVSARCYLSAFGREETFQYVCAQVAAAGNDPQALFTDDGLEAIFAATDGVPRLVNQLGDQLLWMVAETGYAPLDGPIVQQAWSELQQLPAPWNTQTNEPTGAAVEFGELTSDDSELDAMSFEQNSVFEDDSFQHEYDADYDDDLPASIPINAPQPPVEPPLIEPMSVEASSAETIDVTEQLLEELQLMSAPQTQTTAPPSEEVVASNPFDETFESEELVLDRYSTFESLLLAEAPKVVNRTDTAFAQQLQQMEVVQVQTPTPATDLSVEIAASEIPGCEIPGGEIPSGEIDDVESATLAATEFTSEPGDVLIVEQGDQPQTEIVDGQKFRQLFSSLESGEACFG